MTALLKRLARAYESLFLAGVCCWLAINAMDVGSPWLSAVWWLCCVAHVVRFALIVDDGK